MSVPQRQILTDYLRLLRPLRALRMVFSKVRGGELFEKGSKPHPYYPFGQFLSAVFTATFCCFVHVQLLVGERLESR